MEILRREWDSNPRYRYQYNGFRDRPIRTTLASLLILFKVEYKNKKFPGFNKVRVRV